MAITRKAMLIQARKKVVRQQIADLQGAADRACRALPDWVKRGDVRAAQAWKDGATELLENMKKAGASRASLAALHKIRDRIELEIASLEAGV